MGEEWEVKKQEWGKSKRESRASVSDILGWNFLWPLPAICRERVGATLGLA